MIPLIWLKATLAAAAFAALSSITYLGYSKVKSIGYAEAEAKYSQMITDHNNQMAIKITGLEDLSRQLIVLSATNNDALAKDVSNIIKGLKGKTLTIVKNGECVPSKTFSDSLNQINRTVNQNMRGTQK